MTGSNNALALFDRLKVALAANRALPNEVRDWLQDAITAFEESPWEITLCSALGLRGRGIQSIETRRRREARNAALADAIILLQDDPRPAKALRDRIVQFERRKAAMVEGSSTPPHGWDLVDTALFGAYKPGLRVPRSPQYLEALASIRKK